MSGKQRKPILVNGEGGGRGIYLGLVRCSEMGILANEEFREERPMRKPQPISRSKLESSKTTDEIHI